MCPKLALGAVENTSGVSIIDFGVIENTKGEHMKKIHWLHNLPGATFSPLISFGVIENTGGEQMETRRLHNLPRATCVSIISLGSSRIRVASKWRHIGCTSSRGQPMCP